VAEDIKQQIADGARPLAPMRRLRACVESWPEAETGAYDPRCCRFPKSCSATIYGEDTVAEEDLEPAELSVVEVDPEPQPAEAVTPSLRDQLLSMWQEYATSSDVVDDAHLVRWVNALIENLGYASRRLKRAEEPESGPVVLSWPKIVDEATSDLPDVVDVIGDGRWHRLTEPGAEHLYARPGHEDNWRLSLRGLREWGEVREVLT